MPTQICRSLQDLTTVKCADPGVKRNNNIKIDIYIYIYVYIYIYICPCMKWKDHPFIFFNDLKLSYWGGEAIYVFLNDHDDTVLCIRTNV